MSDEKITKQNILNIKAKIEEIRDALQSRDYVEVQKCPIVTKIMIILTSEIGVGYRYDIDKTSTGSPNKTIILVNRESKEFPKFKEYPFVNFTKIDDETSIQLIAKLYVPESIMEDHFPITIVLYVNNKTEKVDRKKDMTFNVLMEEKPATYEVNVKNWEVDSGMLEVIKTTIEYLKAEYQGTVITIALLKKLSNKIIVIMETCLYVRYVQSGYVVDSADEYSTTIQAVRNVDCDKRKFYPYVNIYWKANSATISIKLGIKSFDSSSPTAPVRVTTCGAKSLVQDDGPTTVNTLMLGYNIQLGTLLSSLGCDNTYRVSFNTMQYAMSVHNFIPNIQFDDLIWLCNQTASAHKKINDPCTDNFRWSRSIKSERYSKAVKNGCCGFYDKTITNPKTKNIFWLGFNYGH